MLIPELPQHIDSTMISCFRQCPTKFNTEFVLGLRPSETSIDLHAGACFADALESTYKSIHLEGKSFEDSLLRGYCTFLSRWGDYEVPSEHPKRQDRVWAAVEEYYKQFPPRTDPIQPFIGAGGKPTFEFTFAVPLLPAIDRCPREYQFPLHPSGDPFIYCGRFDMLGRWNGIPVVRDEKTTKSIGNSWSEQWDLRSQFIGYTWACQQLGIPLDTVIIRGIGILKTKITIVEAIKQYSDFLRARWFEQLRRDLWKIRRAWDEEYWDVNFADACSTYGGCPFRPLCSSPNAQTWQSGYTIRRWNPLQKNPIEERKAA